MRSSLALITVVGVLALALTGCASPAPETAPGASSDAVTVTGATGEEPDVDFPTPLKADETECTVVDPGDGEPIGDGQLVELGLFVANGTTGDVLEASGFGDAPPVQTTATATIPGIAKGIRCASAGGRVAVVAPPSDVFGEQGNAQLGIGPDDSLVFVLDIQRVFPAAADGAVRPAKDGFPAVVLAPDGRPGVTVPKTDPPKDFDAETLKEGNGPVVEDGDTVVVKYTGVLWDTGKVFDSTWEQAGGMPATFTVGESGNVVPGFSKAIVGQTVGSQVVAIIPPELGYGDQEQAGIPAGSTLVFVVDILGVATPPAG